MNQTMSCMLRLSTFLASLPPSVGFHCLRPSFPLFLVLLPCLAPSLSAFLPTYRSMLPCLGHPLFPPYLCPGRTMDASRRLLDILGGSCYMLCLFVWLTVSFAVACRGCWMPGANEVLACPRISFKQVPYKIFSIRLAKFLTTFLVVHLNFSNSCPKISDDFFNHSPELFTFSHQFLNFTKIRSLDAPSAASRPGNDIFLFSFSHLHTFFNENWTFGCPQGECPGPSHRSHPPLHPTLFLHNICMSRCSAAETILQFYIILR